MTKSQYYLDGNPVSLIATNIPSFMGGRANPWEKAKNADFAIVGEDLGALKAKDFPLCAP